MFDIGHMIVCAPKDVSFEIYVPIAQKPVLQTTFYESLYRVEVNLDMYGMVDKQM